MIRRQKHRPTVDAAAEADAHRCFGRDVLEPAPNLVRRRPEVGSADGVEVGGQPIALGIEETGVGRVRIRTADQMEFDHVMGRDHARVARMELAGQPFLLEPVVNGVDALRDDQGRAFRAFGEKVAHGAIERARQAHPFAFAGHQSEGAFDGAHGLGRTREDTRPGFIDRKIEDAVRGGIEQIHHSLEVSVARRIHTSATCTTTAQRKKAEMDENAQSE